MTLYMQLMTTTALALSVAACGSSNGVDKVIDVTDITEEAVSYTHLTLPTIE